MNHVLRKNLFKGGGAKKPKVEAAILKPPYLGSFEAANSYNTAEIIDLISDGPIEGLVNQNGKLLTRSQILQGIYLDNTPIEVSNNSTNDLNDSLVLFSNESFFKNNVNKLVKENFDGNGNPLVKYPVYMLAGFYAPFFYQTYSYALISQFFMHQGENNITRIGVYFRAVTESSAAFIYGNNTNIGDLTPYAYGPAGETPEIKRQYNYSSSIWYLIDANASSDFNAANQNTSITTREMHYYSDVSNQKSSLLAKKSIFTEFKSRLQAEINNTNNSDIYKKYLNKLSDILKSVEQIQLGAKTTWDYVQRTFFEPKNEALLIFKVGSYGSTVSSTTTPVRFSTATNNSTTLTENTNPFKISVKNMTIFNPDNIINLLIPKVDNNNILTGEFYGLIVLRIPLVNVYKETGWIAPNWYNAWKFDLSYGELVREDLILNIVENNQSATADPATPRKFNFSNILCEFKNGEEQQLPLNNFNNIYVDYEYNSELYGPFRIRGEVNRIVESVGLHTDTAKNIYDNRSTKQTGGIPTLNDNFSDKEGSQDSSRLAGKSYGSWNDKYEFDEKAIPIIHTVENPNVKSLSFTLAINNLKDTLSQTIRLANSETQTAALEAGDSYPGIVVISVEWGKVTNGVYTVAGSREFSIICLVQGQMFIDFGAADLKSEATNLYSYINPTQDAFQPFVLPNLEKSENPSLTKRYLKITKVSTETNSVLLKRDISLAKVTEIINNNLSYPFSSIAGVKVDARTFSSIPDRSYDCRLKKIKVPNNYYPISSQTNQDKRYISNASTYSNNNQVYIGDWDGSLTERWTDNPAWILYDLLTNKRYGLGNYIDESQINIWELYKIGRFCDAVDDNGYFIGVSDGVGGLEPRYSCNVLFKENIKLFDAINVIANLFRGIVYFANSEIHFLDDRPRTPIAIFSNTNIKNGEFTYNNYRRDQQYNTVEVSYLDRFDNYKTKVEFVEDEIDVRKRGIFKTTINTMGVTSRAMARRIGQHLIYQTLKENQGVEFLAGLETLLCRPGDLILIEDELKTRSTNYGRILSINNSAKTMLIENEYDATDFTGRLTVYTPTGYSTYSETEAIARTNRSRMQQFALTGTLPWTSPSTLLSGNYYFSGYVTGYPANYAGLANFNYPTQFANYTGKHSLGYDLYAYYNTGLTGWVFSTGRAFTNSNTYNQLITNTGIVSISEVIGGLGYKATGYAYDPFTSTRRQAGASTNISNLFYPTTEETNGILDSEINLTNISQITTFNVTGYSGGGDNYAYTLYLDTTDPNINLLQFVAQGSPYRIQRKNAADQIYKVVSIREENQNEYRVVASKYDTGKFAVIEDFSSEDYLPDTYYSGPMKVSSLNPSQLNAPFITTFQTGTTTSTYFNLTGAWNAVANATGYESLLSNSITQFSSGTIHTPATTNYEWTGLGDIGRWDLRIKALGNKSTTWDSQYAKTGTFVVYQTIIPYNRAAVINFKILK